MTIAKVDPELHKLLKATFAILNTGSSNRFPAPLSLSTALEKNFPRAGASQVTLKPAIASLFATAAVDVWLRAVHSFLISASLTQASPIWASVSGYYASHYCIRAFAHLLGYYQLFRRKRIAQLQLSNGKHICSFTNKNASDREHKVYWKIVKMDVHFSADPLFTNNDDDADESDIAHRNRANYGDHLLQTSNFRVLDENWLRERVNHISQIEFTTPPIPKRNRFPDLESVQIVAYQRVVKFRQFVDEIVGGKNRFWRVNRSPTWAAGFIDFQLTEQPDLSSLRN